MNTRQDRPEAAEHHVAGEAVLARAVRILSAFRANRIELGVTEIARLADLHVATASRLVGQLVSLGLLTRTPTGRVRIGMRLWELGQRALPALSLREAAMPFLTDLHAVVGQHVQLGILDGGEVIFLERLSKPGAVVNYSKIAGRLPLHASATGLVLLANSDPEFQEEILAGPLLRLTSATLVDPEELRRFLTHIRRIDAAVTPGHTHPDALGIAVPVRDSRGKVVAALSTTQPLTCHAEGFVTALRAAALGISRSYIGPAAGISVT